MCVCVCAVCVGVTPIPPSVHVRMHVLISLRLTTTDRALMRAIASGPGGCAPRTKPPLTQVSDGPQNPSVLFRPWWPLFWSFGMALLEEPGGVGVPNPLGSNSRRISIPDFSFVPTAPATPPPAGPAIPALVNAAHRGGGGPSTLPLIHALAHAAASVAHGHGPCLCPSPGEGREGGGLCAPQFPRISPHNRLSRFFFCLLGN